MTLESNYGEQELIPSGVSTQLVRHHDLNTNSPVNHVVERTNLINSRNWLENVCVNETCGVFVTKDGTRFSFVKSVAPYTQYDIMPMVFPKEIGDGLETQEIYDFSKTRPVNLLENYAYGFV